MINRTDSSQGKRKCTHDFPKKQELLYIPNTDALSIPTICSVKAKKKRLKRFMMCSERALLLDAHTADGAVYEIRRNETKLLL